ncbi:MAG: hypothetical protein B5M54_00375 [Candidatus Aminicenantes bacterium 4484_214]|nr:MAG: hypothetical protein B5M54_00375 [Candidatus Aminicenantes bacterium 4484_214]
MKSKEWQNEYSAQDLLVQLQEGDEEALNLFIQIYQQKIFRLAYAFFGDREEALDVVQETFMRVYEKISHFQKTENVQGWLLKIARNICIDRYRHQTSKKRRPEFPFGERNMAEMANDGSLEKQEELQPLIARALEELTPRQRLVVILKHMNGSKFEEIAQVLGIAEGTVKSLHFKALRNLRRILKPVLGRVT